MEERTSSRGGEQGRWANVDREAQRNVEGCFKRYSNHICCEGIQSLEVDLSATSRLKYFVNLSIL